MKCCFLFIFNLNYFFTKVKYFIVSQKRERPSIWSWRA